MTFFLFLIAVKFILLGAVYGRLDGGGIAKVSEWVERSLVMFGFVLACAPVAGLYALGAYAGVTGIVTGHGQYFLNVTRRPVSEEFFDFIVEFFFGKDPRTLEQFKFWRGLENWENAPEDIKEEFNSEIERYELLHGKNWLYWRAVFGMFVTGMLVGIPAFLILQLFNNPYASLFLLTGIVKSLSYMIGWKFFKSTEIAEYLNGAGRNALCLLIIFLTIQR